MSPRAQVYWLGLLLMLISLSVVVYKGKVLGLPLLPGEYQTVWTVEAKVEFVAQGEPVKVSLALPKDQARYEVLDEVFSSSGYGFAVDTAGAHRRAQWTRRSAQGKQSLYYKLDLHQLDNLEPTPVGEVPAVVPPDWSSNALEPLRIAAQALINNAQARSSGAASFTRQLIMSLSNNENQDAQVVLDLINSDERSDTVLQLLAYAGQPARIIRGIELEDDRSRLRAKTLLEVFDGKQWQVFSPYRGEQGLPQNFMVWQRGDVSLLDVEGGENSRVRFSILANDVPARSVALNKMARETVTLMDYSIYSLPIEQQSIFKFILLVPVGALIVIVLRVVVGVRTAGTFMPVLLAIAFIQTSLLNGVLIFLLVLGVGLFVRSYLDRLDLLLIARIAAVVVIVVGVMATLSIVSYKLGLEQALTVTFFPMIIIAWTIEHMSILWEDDGPMEVLIQTAGSLLVAILCYVVMTNRYVEHWMFNFPELLLALLGITVVLGHYTGYRLSELLRFRHMRLQ